MIQDIDLHIKLLDDTVKWARDYGKDTFPSDVIKEYRRKLKRIRESLRGNCSAAAYGESQVGKSYLMSSLLSSPDTPFVIRNKGVDYSFIDQLNPSGGSNSKIESTGVVTRFTITADNPEMEEYVKVTNLTPTDIILLLVDSYYNDIKIKPDSVLRFDQINAELDKLSRLWETRTTTYDIISEDDIKDIGDYIREIIGTAAAGIYQSNFVKTVAPMIKYVDPHKWVEVFRLLWNRNPEIDKLFITLMDAYQRLGFHREVYVPFDAVLRSKGTLLKIDWLDGVCGRMKDPDTDVPVTDVYDRDGNLIARDFPKSELSALIAELTFILPPEIAKDRAFLNKIDLLDFPGARTREKFEEEKMADVIPQMLRRGKVAYLFNKYSRSLQISSVLFCHHQEQKSGPTVGETVNSWIETNIGRTPAERGVMLADTNGIAPLFLIATKFNIDLERTKNDNADDLSTLDKHWARFDTVYPEIIKPNKWMTEWVEPGGRFRSAAFRNVYPLRDFYWSAKNGLFTGYSDRGEKSPEISEAVHADFPDYMPSLRRSFLKNDFVRLHFNNPEEAWDSFATLNNDGSKAIIDSLDGIADVLDTARTNRYKRELVKLRDELAKVLEVYYEPENTEAKNRKVWKIAGDIRRSLVSTIARQPEVFGRIIDALMVRPEDVRNIAYDIIICHTETPVDVSPIDFYRQLSGVKTSQPREENISKLLDYFMLENEEELADHVATLGFTVDDIVTSRTKTLSTMGDLVTKHLVDLWVNHLNARAKQLESVLPHADEVVFMLISLFDRLGLRDIIAKKINTYCDMFSENETPNAIGDFAALTLNNFVSTVGRNYIKDEELPELKAKAEACHLSVDFSPLGLEARRQPQPLIETLKIFDEMPERINQGPINPVVLSKLPFWSNFQKWENLVNIGLLYSSDISRCNPECNKKVASLIERTNGLYH